MTSATRSPRFFARIAKMLRSSVGAFDLTSVLVGAAVVAVLVGGAAAIVFGVIPYAQDQSAKQDLDAVRTSQGITRVGGGRFVSLADLENSSLSNTSGLAAATNADGTCYVALSQSDSGTTYMSTSSSPQPVEITGPTDTGCVSTRTLNALSVEATGSPLDSSGRMTTEWNTGLTAECSTITVPLTGTINATVDWGDGTVETITAPLPAHSYTGPQGPRTITIDGTFSGWVGVDWPTWSYDCLTAVTEWGETGTTDVEGAFAYTPNLTKVANPPTTVTAMPYFFYDAGASVQGPETWDMSTVTNMANIFYGSYFNGDVSQWDTSRVTDMSRLFGRSPFSGNISTWDTSNVASMAGMFSDTSFNGDISNWDTSRVTDMSQMFTNASAFHGDISHWDTSNVVNASMMFYNSGFNSDISSWNTARVKDMSWMFTFASFAGDISRWNTASVTTMTSMFWGNNVNRDISNWDTSSVTDMSYMFLASDSFNGDLGRWNTTNVTNMYQMFYAATGFNQNISSWNTSNVTDMTQMFFAASRFNQNLSGWNTAKVTAATEFSYGSALTADHLPPGALFR